MMSRSNSFIRARCTCLVVVVQFGCVRCLAIIRRPLPETSFIRSQVIVVVRLRYRKWTKDAQENTSSLKIGSQLNRWVKIA